MKISEEIINDVRNSASITEVIGHYIPLIKKGRGYTAVCPFHDDHDPSLSISEDKQIFKCFVCGKGGNVFSFVQDFKKISFPESVIEVADIIGKHLDIEYNNTPKKVSPNQQYYDLLNKMIEYSNYLLVTNLGKDAKNYLDKRGIDDSIIEKYNIGYNPEGNKIYEYLNNQGFKDENMIKTGVCRMMNNGMADVFYRRVLFPIHDKDGNPVGFTARDITGESNSKYINTSDTIIYTKGDIVYNYHRARQFAKQSTNIIVTEGVMDVIAYERAGIYNVVATLGTNFTKNQLELIKSLSNNIVLSYDGDKAGQAANMKLGEICLSYGLNVSVIDNETQKDPDEIVNEYGKNALRDLKTIGFIDYAIKYYKQIHNLNNYNDRKTMALKVYSLIDKLKDEYDRENYTNDILSLTKIRKTSQVETTKKEYTKKVNYELSLDGLTKAEYTVLLQMSVSIKGKEIYEKELGCLLDETNQNLAFLIIEDYRNNQKCSLARIYDETNDEDIKKLIINLGTIDTIEQDFDEEILKGAINKIKDEIKKDKLNNLKRQIAEYESVDPNKASEIMNEYLELIKQIGGTYNG